MTADQLKALWPKLRRSDFISGDWRNYGWDEMSPKTRTEITQGLGSEWFAECPVCHEPGLMLGAPAGHAVDMGHWAMMDGCRCKKPMTVFHIADAAIPVFASTRWLDEAMG